MTQQLLQVLKSSGTPPESPFLDHFERPALASDTAGLDSEPKLLPRKSGDSIRNLLALSNSATFYLLYVMVIPLLVDPQAVIAHTLTLHVSRDGLMQVLLKQNSHHSLQTILSISYAPPIKAPCLPVPLVSLLCLRRHLRLQRRWLFPLGMDLICYSKKDNTFPRSRLPESA